MTHYIGCGGKRRGTKKGLQEQLKRWIYTLLFQYANISKKCVNGCKIWVRNYTKLANEKKGVNGCNEKKGVNACKIEVRKKYEIGVLGCFFI